MDSIADNAPPDWIDILQESETELATGQIVSAEAVHRDLQDSIARLEAKAATRRHDAT